jgi:hypothetical protein
MLIDLFPYRIRRVKCDEERPSCKRCIKFGTHCDGYANQDYKFVTTIKPRPLRAAGLSLYAPSVGLPLNEQEMKYFQDFIQDSSLGHQGRCFVSQHQLLFSDSFFWNGIVLQESHATACARHAVVALGALARSMQQIRSRELQCRDEVGADHPQIYTMNSRCCNITRQFKL